MPPDARVVAATRLSPDAKPPASNPSPAAAVRITKNAKDAASGGGKARGKTPQTPRRGSFRTGSGSAPVTPRQGRATGDRRGSGCVVTAADAAADGGPIHRRQPSREPSPGVSRFAQPPPPRRRQPSQNPDGRGKAPRARSLPRSRSPAGGLRHPRGGDGVDIGRTLSAESGHGMLCSVLPAPGAPAAGRRQQRRVTDPQAQAARDAAKRAAGDAAGPMPRTTTLPQSPPREPAGAAERAASPLRNVGSSDKLRQRPPPKTRGDARGYAPGGAQVGGRLTPRNSANHPSPRRKGKEDGLVGLLLDNFGIPSADLDVDTSQVLGRGGFGIVYKGDYQGTEVAVKMMYANQELGKEQLDEWKKEVMIMTRLRHPNILMLLGAVFEKGDLAIVTEYCEKGTLKQIVREMTRGTRPPVKWGKKIDWMTQAAKGMAFLHYKRVHHRDLKASNIFVTGDTMKIADFGLSKFRIDAPAKAAPAGDDFARSPTDCAGLDTHVAPVSPTPRTAPEKQTLQEAFRAHNMSLVSPLLGHSGGIGFGQSQSEANFMAQPSQATLLPAAVQKSFAPGSVEITRHGSPAEAGDASGTFAFVAPEVWRGTPFGDAADVYAFGIMIIEVLTARVPFDDVEEDEEDRFAIRIAQGTARPRVPKHIGGEEVPHTLRNIAKACYNPNRRQRPGFTAVVARLLREQQRDWASDLHPVPYAEEDEEEGCCEEPVEEIDEQPPDTGRSARHQDGEF